jgi:DNA modification methylase
MDPVIEIGGARVFHGDCREVLKAVPDNSIDSIVTDPPYELGFMGKKWDSSGIAYDVTVWAECLRVLKPGGHLLAFGGSRTYHRLGVAIEDAGFEIRDTIAWISSKTFPKSLNVSKAIDKSDAKVERRARDLRFTAWMRSTGITAKEINDLTSSNMGSHYLTDKEQPAVPTEDMFSLLRPHLPEVPEDIERLVFDRTVESKNFAEREVIGQDSRSANESWLGTAKRGEKGFGIGEWEITSPATSEAKTWEGWGTGLKQVVEPVVMARKPLDGTVAENTLRWGVGGINIDDSRIATTDNLAGGTYGGTFGAERDENGKLPKAIGSGEKGRWPANVILDEVSADILDEQSGVTVSKPSEHGGYLGNSLAIGGSRVSAYGSSHNDSGGASRFFYVAKASKRDRNEGLEHIKPQKKYKSGGIGGTGGAADADQVKNQKPAHNYHPTVKPTQLMRYLIKLVTPPGGTVLDPFTGSGSTGKAALLDGFGFVGVELTEEYLPIIEGRLKWANEQGVETDERLF